MFFWRFFRLSANFRPYSCAIFYPNTPHNSRPLARGQKVSRHTSGWSRRSPISLYVFQRVLFSLNMFGRAFEFVARCTSRLSHSHAVERARSTGVSPNSWWKKLSVDTKLALVGEGEVDHGRLGTLLCAVYPCKSRPFSWPFFSFSGGPIFKLLWYVRASPSYFLSASRHDWTIWFLRVSSAFCLQLGTLDTAARPIDSTDHIREAARWPLFVWQFVLVTPLQHLFVSSSIEAGCCWEKGTVLEAEREEAVRSTNTRRLEGFYSWKVCRRCLPDYFSSFIWLPDVKQGSCLAEHLRHIDIWNFVRHTHPSRCAATIRVDDR